MWYGVRMKSTPLLLAASSGALSTLRALIELGADVLQCDQLGNNVIHLASLRCHANILEFFSACQQPLVDVWLVLVGKSQLQRYISPVQLHHGTRCFLYLFSVVLASTAF